MTLKEAVLANEEILCKNLEDQLGLGEFFFKAKVESFKYDGDIIKFLRNFEVKNYKAENFDIIHKHGYKTAVDIMNEFIFDQFKCSKIDELEENSYVSAMTICALADNFNNQVGMYYNEKEDFLLIKTQVKEGPYEDSWIEQGKSLSYDLQNEKTEEVYRKLDFKNKPNKICKDLILGFNNHTKVYLFYRYNKGADYIFDGRYIVEGFLNNNHSILIKKYE